MPEPSLGVAEIAVELAERSAAGGRVIFGIAGPPGAGKSTVAEDLRDRLGHMGVQALIVPMDGYHLADVTLQNLGRLDRKGAIDTFDGYGYVSLLKRLREETVNTVFAPGFERRLEQPLAAAIAVDPGVQVVITEGNYLLVDQEPWNQVPGLLDDVVYVHLDDDERRRRLRARHERFGKSPEHAREWVDEVDQPNAALVGETRDRASRVLTA